MCAMFNVTKLVFMEQRGYREVEETSGETFALGAYV